MYLNRRNENIFYLALFGIVFGVFFTLSMFRYPVGDGSYYLKETANFARILSEGRWIGNEAVGLHGFLFKFPPALLFLFFGPGVFIATLFHVFLAAVSAVLFFILLKKYFPPAYRLGGVALLATGFNFILAAVTYVREMPLLFSLMLFLYCLTRRKHSFLIGLTLLLVLDAKEYVFFQIVPGLGLYLICRMFFFTRGRPFAGRLKEFLFDALFFFSPATVFIFLMFLTPLIPVNMFVAYILTITERGAKYVINDFKGGADYAGTSVKRLKESVFVKQTSVSFFQRSGYLTKFFLPRMFSYVSTPKIIVVPALIQSVRCFFLKTSKLKEDGKPLFFILVSIFITFYFRTGHARYTFAMAPLFIIFFLDWFANFRRDRGSVIIFIITALAVVFGLFFELRLIKVKILIHTVLLGLLLVMLFNHKFKWLPQKFLLTGWIIAQAVIALGATIAASFILDAGQIYRWRIHGYSGEIGKVAQYAPNNQKIWHFFPTVEGKLMHFYLQERIDTPEWYYFLKKWIPKKKMLRRYPNPERVFTFWAPTYPALKQRILAEKIDLAFCMVSHDQRMPLNPDSLRQFFIKDRAFELARTVPLKNKTLYIFNVIRQGKNE